MSDSPNESQAPTERQEALVVRLESSLSEATLGLIESAEARYAATVAVTTAPVTVTTTTAT